MKSRRKFIAQGTLAAAAFTALKPVQTFANTSIFSSTGFNANDNTVVLVHSGNNPRHADYAAEKITALKKTCYNMLVLAPAITPDADSYQIIYRGNIKTGIIKANANDNISSLNHIAAYLKKEKNCKLIVCVSPLGYKNKAGLDDITLAEKSTHIDIIIGNNTANHSPFPAVIKNSNQAEVLIHSAVDNGFGLGNIEIAFDNKTGAKKTIAFNNLLSRLPQTA